MDIAYLIVNFGGPRTLQEVEPFLISLLTDQDVVRTNMPAFIHRLLFQRIAKKRAKKIVHDYAQIGGGSPIYADTEAVALGIHNILQLPVLTFHRYLTETHSQFLATIESINADEIHVLPMFPQFTFATTGSCARFFCRYLSKTTLHKLRWVKSYPAHHAFIKSSHDNIKNFLKSNQIDEKECAIIFSAHGVPQQFINTGDLYEKECQESYQKITAAFPDALHLLSYQSKFGPGEWLRPYTEDVCTNVKQWCQEKKHILFYPLSFTSDHIETLFEVEQLYMPLISQNGLRPWRIPALNRDETWINAMIDILKEGERMHNCMLVRCNSKSCC